MSDTKATMTLNLRVAEMLALEQLAKMQDLNKTQIIRQALRLYQKVRLTKGRIFFEEDECKIELIIL